VEWNVGVRLVISSFRSSASERISKKLCFVAAGLEERAGSCNGEAELRGRRVPKRELGNEANPAHF
jgi:hypothetical protein